MTLIVTIAAVAIATQPVAAHHAGAHPPAAQRTTARTAADAAVRAVLSQYMSAIERLDATGTERLFTPDSTIFETGGVEGTYAYYLAHHLGPELKAFKSFRFFDYKVDVRLEGPLALASESYNYRIETKKGEVVERRGVATSVLKKVGAEWKIISMHNSGRKPKGS